jgi:UDP-2,4-diacetamido-2,4,6-trideoxy-beta-L-altropyranose hydrolase
MKIGLRVEASAEIGYGHWMRTIAIGEGLRARGAECMVLTRSDAQTTLPRCNPDDAHNIDVLLADLYRPTQAELGALKQTAEALVCIDDGSPFVFDCALLINPNFGFAHKMTPATRYMSGGAFIPLRAQFRSPPPHPIRPQIKRLLVCFGGSDPLGLTVRVASHLGKNPDARVAIVVGPAYRDAEKLQPLVAGERYTLYRNVTDMLSLFSEADLGILGAGTLMYEAAATGLPALFLSSNEMQHREASAVAAAGAGLCRHGDEPIGEALGALKGEQTRRDLSERARRLVDGRGAERIVQAILELGQ